MTNKQLQRWQRIGGFAPLLAGLCAVAWVILVPIEVSIPQTTAGGGEQPLGTSASNEMYGQSLTADQLQDFSTIRLRRPLKDPPRVVVAPPPMRARLLGTIYQPGHPEESQALFQLIDGSQRFFKVGQQFDEPGGAVVIKHVGDHTASVEYRDEQRELKVEGR